MYRDYVFSKTLVENEKNLKQLTLKHSGCFVLQA